MTPSEVPSPDSAPELPSRESSAPSSEAAGDSITVLKPSPISTFAERRPLRLLVVDDDLKFLKAIERAASDAPGLRALGVSTFDGALEAANDDFDLLLVDVILSDDPGAPTGFDLIEAIRARGTNPPVVILSGSADPSHFQRAIRLGVREYVLKREVCRGLLVRLAESCRETAQRGGHQRSSPRDASEAPAYAGELVGSSAPIQRLKRAIAHAADADAPVLLLGEPGTGKEHVARAIHHAGLRRDEPFVVVECATIPAESVAGALLGHERAWGRGTEPRRRDPTATAGAGTIFLDGLGELAAPVQSKLLCLLEGQQQPVGGGRGALLHARLIAATNCDLESAVQRGAFRLDLFHRLNTLQIRVPSLAERGPADFEELLVAFAGAQRRRLTFTRPAVDWLATRPWPCNIRELNNVVRRLVVFSPRDEVDVATLEELARTTTTEGHADRLGGLVDSLLDAPLPESVSRFHAIEGALLQRALDISEGNKAAAARLLGIPRQVFARRVGRAARPPGDKHPDDDE